MSTNRGRFTFLLSTCLVALVPSAWGAKHEDASAAAAPTLSTEDLAARYGLDPATVHDGPVAGLYEVAVGIDVSYVTTDGKLMIKGDVYDLTTRDNLTEARRADARAALIAQIDPAKEIVFSPQNGVVKHRVTIFTDVDCGYCREFHREIAKVNELGIEVRYVSYPRTGPNTESWAKAEGVWCAADPKMALTQAKRGGEVAAVPDCHSAPIAEEYELGKRVGLTGTPGVYSETGVELGGYLPPDQLLAALEKLAAR